MSKEALIKAIEVVGNQVRMADEIKKRNGSNVKQQHVWKWLNTAKCPVPPAEHVLAIEAATREKGIVVSRHELRPDIYPYE